MMGLRLSEGIDRHRYIALGGRDLDSHALDYLANIGMIKQSPHRISTTRSGRMVLNAIIKELLVVP
jgi:oxygen-independent coproporphyrinogen-3 oxidase